MLFQYKIFALIKSPTTVLARKPKFSLKKSTLFNTFCSEILNQTKNIPDSNSTIKIWGKLDKGVYEMIGHRNKQKTKTNKYYYFIFSWTTRFRDDYIGYLLIPDEWVSHIMKTALLLLTMLCSTPMCNFTYI